MKVKSLIILLIILISLQFIFIWHIDLSTGAKNSLTNGFHQYDPMIVYHISLWGLLLVNFIIAFIVVNLTIGKGVKGK